MRQQRLPCASHPNLYYFHEISREVEVTPYLGEATVISRSIDTPSVTPQVSGDISQRPPMSLFRVGAFPEAPWVSSAPVMWEGIVGLQRQQWGRDGKG